MNELPQDMAAGAQIHVGQGQVASYQGTRFGGVCCLPATSSAAAQVVIAIRHRAREVTVQLHEGGILRLPDQMWQLQAIHATGCRWYATLARTG